MGIAERSERMGQFEDNKHYLAVGDNYEIEKRLTTGGMAEILLAWQTGPSGFRRRAVIKRPLPHLSDDREFIALFRREANIATELVHENIVTVYEVLEGEPGQTAIVMEYVPGQTVYALLKRANQLGIRLPFPVAVHILVSVCHALNYAYNGLGQELKPRGIVHRDVSPTNILLNHNGQVKLADFGIARTFTTDSVTRTGVLRGKVRYMSPEQIRGERLDQRSDLFSLGTVAYELLTGVKAFDRKNSAMITNAVLDGELTPMRTHNPEVTDSLQVVINNALSPNRDYRYQDAEHFAADLTRVIGEDLLSSAPEDLAQLLSELFSPEADAASISSWADSSSIQATGSHPTGSQQTAKSTGALFTDGATGSSPGEQATENGAQTAHASSAFSAHGVRRKTRGLVEGQRGLATPPPLPGFSMNTIEDVPQPPWVIMGILSLAASVTAWVWLIL